MVSNEVYLLPLNDDGSPQVAGEYIYLAPKCNDPVIIRFAIEGTSSICRHGSLWVNIPEQGAEFRRDKFREFKCVASVSNGPIDGDRVLIISLPQARPGLQSHH
jgi:glycogen debranching enzyme